jgi:hypothetical protein
MVLSWIGLGNKAPNGFAAKQGNVKYIHGFRSFAPVSMTLDCGMWRMAAAVVHLI